MPTRQTQPGSGPPPYSAPYDPKSPPPKLQDPISPSSTLNPPASTRPPPLDLPTKTPEDSLFGHFYRVGKAYMGFYKAGMKAIFTNRRLLRSSSAAAASANSAAALTRADVLLRARTRHDLSRLPVFAVLLLVCGEFTPLVVLAFPHLTPLTCRIPKQVEALRRAAAERRAASFRALAHRRQSLAPILAFTGQSSSVPSQGEEGKGKEQEPAPGRRATGEEAAAAAGHVARSLGLTSVWWDRLGVEGGGPFARGAADRAVAALARDDALIRAAAPHHVAGLEDDEVLLACDDRGIDVRGKPVAELRRRLDVWVRESDAADEEGRRARVRALLLRPEVSV